MGEIIALVAIVLVMFLAIFYVIKTKKKGKCIGCPHSDTCKFKNDKSGCNQNKL